MSENRDAIGIIVGMAIGAMGGLARALAKDERTSVGKMLASAFVSLFAGLIVGLICKANAIDMWWTSALCGLAGWSGRPILDALAVGVEKLFKRGGAQ